MSRPREWIARPSRASRCLVAEDHPVNRTVVVRLLGNLGAIVEAAANGREALERFSNERFDILLLDLEMPEIDGIGVAREIRARERGTKAHLPIVALTAHAREEQRELLLSHGYGRLRDQALRGKRSHLRDARGTEAIAREVPRGPRP